MPLTSFTPSYGTSFAGLRPSAVNAGVVAAGTGTVALKPLLLPQGAGAMRDNPLPMGKGRSKRLLALSGLFALIGLAFALRYRPAITNNYTTGASGTEAAGVQEDVVAVPLDEFPVVDPVAGDVLDVIEVDTFEPLPPIVELPPLLPPVNRTTFADIPTPTIDEEAAPGDVGNAVYGAAACATLVAGIAVLCKSRNAKARSPRQRRRADSCHRCGTPFKASQCNALFSHESDERLNVVGDGRVMTQESPPRGSRPFGRPGTPHPKRKHSKGFSDDDDGDTVTPFAIAPPPVSRSSASPSENVVSRPNPSGNRRGTAIATLFSGLVIVGCATANHQRAQRARSSASGPTSPKPQPRKPKAEEPKEPEPKVSSEDVKCDFDILAMLRESAARTGTYSVILPAPPSVFTSPSCQPPAAHPATPPAFAIAPIISSPPLAAVSVSAPLTFLTTGARGGGLDWRTCYLHLLCGLVCFFVLSFLPLPERFTGETVAMQMEEAERRRREAEEEEEEGKKEREKEKAEKANSKEGEKEMGDGAKERAETEIVGDTSDSFIAPQSPSPASSSSGAKAIKPLPLPGPRPKTKPPSELPLDTKPTTPCIPSNPCIPRNPSAKPTTAVKLKFKTPTNVSIEEPLFETPVETFCTSDPGRASSSSDDSEGTLRTIALDVVESGAKGAVAVKAKVEEEVSSNVEGRVEEVTQAEVNVLEAHGTTENRAKGGEEAEPEHLVESRMEVIVDASYNMSDYLPPPSPENSCEVVEVESEQPILSVVPLAVEKVDECKPKVEGPFEFLPVPRRERKSATLEIIYEWACDLELGVYIDVPSEEFKSFETITLTHDNLNPRYIFDLGIPPEVKDKFPSALTGNEKPKEWYTTISGTPRLLESSTPIQRRSMKTARPTVTTSSVAATAPSASSDRMLEERARARQVTARPAQNDANANTRTSSPTSTMARARTRLVPSSASILLARRTMTPAERNEMDVTRLRASRKGKGKEKAEEGETTPKACTSASAPTDRARGADATPIQRTPLASVVSVVRSSAEKRATVDRLLAERRARRAAEAASSSGPSSSAPTTYAASATASSSAPTSSSTPPATVSTRKASMLSSSAPPPSFALPSSAQASVVDRRGLSSSSWAPRSSAPSFSAARSSLLSSSAPPSSAPISSFSARSSSVLPNSIPFPVPQGATIAERTAARRLIRETRLASLPPEDRVSSNAERAKPTEVTRAKEVHQQAPAQEVQRDIEQVGRDVERQHRPRSLPPKKNDWEVKEALDDAASLYARRERERQRLARLAEDSAKEARVREHRPRSQRAEGASSKEQRQRTEEFKVDEVKAMQEREHRPRSQRASGSTTTATARTTTTTTITAATMYTSTTTRASPKRPSTSVKRVDSTPMPKVEDDLFSESGTPGVPVRPFKTPPRVRWPRRSFV